MIKACVFRHMMKYFREPSTVIFSLLSILITVGLYIFFLADVQIQSAKQFADRIPDIEAIVNLWVIGGLVCIPAISVPLMIYCFRLEDIVSGIERDFRIGSIKNWKISLGYILSGWLVGFIMSVITLGVSQIYMRLLYGIHFTLKTDAVIISILAVLVFAFAGFSYFCVSFLSKMSALTAVNSILNTLIGFFAALYMPIGALSEQVGMVIKIVPIAQVAALIRSILLDGLLIDNLGGFPTQVISDFKSYYGIDIVINGHMMTMAEIISFTLVFGLLFYGLSFAVNNWKDKYS